MIKAIIIVQTIFLFSFHLHHPFIILQMDRLFRRKFIMGISYVPDVNRVVIRTLNFVGTKTSGSMVPPDGNHLL